MEGSYFLCCFEGVQPRAHFHDSSETPCLGADGGKVELDSGGIPSTARWSFSDPVPWCLSRYLRHGREVRDFRPTAGNLLFFTEIIVSLHNYSLSLQRSVVQKKILECS